ncbi:MAG: amino acid adenylation domain-containing protein [Pyrinomonadaceae bacterium]|nr:amino acid adenylation domain-containing protein [Pyrinomonadaceae bacterium]
MFNHLKNESKEYWLDKLSAEFSFTDLMSDQDLPDVERSAYETINFKLSGESFDLLAEKTNKSPFLIYTVLLSALNLCLYRYTKNEIIVVGSPARVHQETEDQISNALPIINKIDTEMSFKEFLKSVRNTLVEAYQHQSFDYDYMIEAVKADEHSDKFPLFDISMSLSGIHSDLPNVGNGINLILTLQENDLSVELSYKKYRYKTETIDRFSAHFQNILFNALKDLEQPLPAIEMIDDEEREQLMKLSGKEGFYPTDYLTASELFERSVDRFPDLTAIIFDEISLTYAELDAAANRLAHFLRAKNITAEKRVAIMLERGAQAITAVLAIFKCGGIYVPLDASYPKDRLNYMIEDAMPELILTQTELEEKLPQTTAQVVRLDKEAEAIHRLGSERLEKSAEFLNGAYMIYTSGSTGKPKGVVVTHTGLESLAKEQAEKFGVVAGSRVLQFASLSFDASVSEIIVTLANGGVLCLAEKNELSTDTSLSRVIREMQIDIATLPPALLSVISPDEDSGLKTIIAAGEACNPQIVEKWGKGRRFLNAYGPTEATVCATIWEYDGQEAVSGRVGIGKPIGNSAGYVLDERMRLLPLGVAGELYLGGVGVARGYWERRGLTAERFVPHPFSSVAGARLYRTGDLARFRADGQLEYLGRVDRQVKIRGYRVELGEIEGQLRSCPAVADAVVELRLDGRGEKQLVGYFVAAETGGAEIAGLQAYLRERLPEYMLPTRYLALEKIPLTRNGKVDRAALPALPAESGESAPRRTDADPVAELLVAVWEELLGVRVTDHAADFFAAGGHSLLATQLISRVRETFGVELELGAIFDHPQLAALAQLITKRLGAGGAEVLAPLEAVAGDAPLPLSYAQQRMWFLNQLEGTSGSYNIGFPLHVKGALDTAALGKAIDVIRGRHAILRTAFAVDEAGNLRQRIEARNTPARIAAVDLTQVAGEAAHAQARELAKQEMRTAFDLNGGELFRVLVMKLREDESVLMITMHHIISDGWSTGIFVRELAAAYRAALTGTSAGLPALPVQYADYAVWQRKHHSEEGLAGQLEYWKRQLGTDTPTLELPTDRPRPLMRSFNGAKQRIVLAAELTEGLREVSRRHQATLFMTLLSAFKVLLGKLSGQTDIAVGTPIANRRRRELEELIGFFVNTLVIRSRLKGGQSFGEYLAEVRQLTLAAYANQDIPFERLVEELRPERDLSRTPLFEAMFVMQNTPQEILELPGIELSGYEVEQETAKFDLTLTADEAANGELVVGMEYNTDIFDQLTIRSFLLSFRQLLTSISADSSTEIRNLEVVGEDEREELMKLSGRDSVYATDSLTASELFERSVDRFPELTAVVSADASLTYAELDAAANRLAHFLRSKNITVEKRVAIMFERSAEMITAMLAIFKCGGIYVPLDAAYPKDRLNYMIEDAMPELILTNSVLEERLPWTTAEVVRLDEEAEVLKAQSNERPERTAELANGAYMIYTSGSTGKPKGVVVTHSGLESVAKEQSESFGAVAGSRVLQFNSLSFDASIFDISMAIFNGATLYLPDRESGLPGLKMSEYLKKNEISIISLTPTALSSVPFSEFPHLKTINIAGEPCSIELADKWSEGRNIFNLYGPTEATIWSTIFNFDENVEQMAIGKPISNTEVYVLDERMRTVPMGVTGELFLGGVGVARGYWQRSGLTAERFVPHPFSRVAGARLYRTGDLARFRADGQLEFLGRVDRQVKIRGFRVELGEIESVIKSLDGIKEAVVNPSTDDKGITWLTAYYVAMEGTEPDTAKMREMMQEELPNYMIPARFIGLEKIPVSPNGKIDRKKLPQSDEAKFETGTAYNAPTTEAELVIADIWCEILNIKKVGIEDNFFTLGGHSLLLAQMHAKLVQKFEKEISLIDLFKYPTIKTLAEFLTNESNSEANAGRGRERAETRLDLRNKQADLRRRAREKRSGN